jgi:two-component system, NarL family, nitrate/nitrite response regulator NarL
VRIVLVNSHRLVVDALAEALARYGVTVAAQAKSPQDALNAVASHEPEICLLAASSPGGLDVLRLLRRRYPAVKVVMFSDGSDPALVSAAMEAGAAGFIGKEQHIADMVAALIRVSSGEQAFDADPGGPADNSLRSPPAAYGDCLLRVLTLREQEVLMLMMEGASTKQIARSLAITLSTARTHVQSVLVKLGAHSRLEATSIVARTQLLSASGSHSLGQQAQAAAASG